LEAKKVVLVHLVIGEGPRIIGVIGTYSDARGLADALTVPTSAPDRAPYEEGDGSVPLTGHEAVVVCSAAPCEHTHVARFAAALLEGTRDAERLVATFDRRSWPTAPTNGRRRS
jgi:hypothetical protein